MLIVKDEAIKYRIDLIEDGVVLRGNNVFVKMNTYAFDFIKGCLEIGIKEGVEAFKIKNEINEQEMIEFMDELKNKLYDGHFFINLADEIDVYLRRNPS